MALYKGNIQISGGGSGNVREFTPENQGSTGQILTKTATGYDWETNSGGQTYTAGANITIDSNNEISAIDTTYSAGANVTIDANNEISATDTTYVAGDFDIKDLADSTGLRTSWSGKADASDINTKTFYLSSASDLTNAQAAYDWYAAGKNPIIVYDYNDYNRKGIYTLSGTQSNGIIFYRTSIERSDYADNHSSKTYQPGFIFYVTNGNVTSISPTQQNGASFLAIDIDYSSPYTPLYNGSPATKKYVDDSLSAKISAGTTAPSNPTEGQLWYDSTNDVLKVYDGTQWNSVGGGGGGGSYTAGANIDITNDVISAENVIVTDAINDTGFKIEDANDNFADIGLSNTYEIKIGNEQDDQQGNYDYTDIDLIGNTGTIGGHNYHETPSIEDHREYYITPEGIEATREITSGGETTTTTENYYWIDDGLGNTDEKIAKLGDIVTYTAGTNISIDANNEISATDTTYSASDFDIKDLTDSTSLRTTWSGKQDAFFTSGSTAPANPSEGDAWYDTTNDIFKTYDGTNWNVTSNFPGMTILSYGHNTWQDFLDAYNKNAIVYCRASSNANPATGSQTRMAFMAYVNNAENPTEVEFQYYRSRSDHNSATNQLDQVFVYKLTSAGTWTVTERNTAAKAVAGTGISLAFGSGNMTISASAQYDDTAYAASWDGVIDKAPTKNAVYDKISAMDTTISGKQNALTAGTNIQIDSNTNTISATDTTYSAGDGIGISANNEISADIFPSTQTGAASTIKIWLGSQSDYDNLASYDSGTLYFTTSS